MAEKPVSTACWSHPKVCSAVFLFVLFFFAVIYEIKFKKFSYYNTTLNFTELFRKRHIFSQMLVKAGSMARCLILHTCDNKTLKYLKSSIKTCGL